MDAHHEHSQEVAKSGVAEALLLIFQKEKDIERLMEETKAEAEKIIEEAKKEAQEIRNKREEANRQAASQKASAVQQQKGESRSNTAIMATKNLPMTEEEKKQIQRLKETAEQNTGKVVEMVLKAVIP